MLAERLQVIEPKEKVAGVSPQWLAGVFEIAGGMGFSTYESKGNYYAYPYVHFTDKDQVLINLFRRTFGGRVIYKDTSSEWRIEGESALAVAETLGKFAPSRREMVSLFFKWEEATVEERVEVAREITASYRTGVDDSDYYHLVVDPEFVAGVVDARGSFYAKPEGGPRINSRQFIIASRNIDLMEALRSLYGGNIYYRERESRKEEGDNMEIWNWTISKKGDMINLLVFCHFHLRKKDPAISPVLQGLN